MWLNVFYCFAGDIGGYMGLLLGGSAITILEFLDLIIYNTLRKLSDRNGNANKKELTIDNKVPPLDEGFS